MCLPPRDDVAKTTTTTAPRPTRRLSFLPTTSTVRRPRQPPPVQVDMDDRVTFRVNLEEVHEIPTALSCMGEDQDRSQLWYNREDMKEFRRQAQVLSRKCREQQGNSTSDEVCTRGLELRMSLQRQDRKQMIVRRILDAQDEEDDPALLARIAQQHSIWSRKLALAQAHKDYYAAYHPNLTSVLPEMPALLDCSRDFAKKRSLLGSPLGQGRRVRCRMF